MANRDDQRFEFVKGMYQIYWNNVSRSMDGIWKVLAPITLVGTVIAGIYRGFFPPLLGVLFALTIMLWAINITIDLNAWHRRNLFFITNAEKAFLSESDYGYLLPKKYQAPPRSWITFYKINIYIFIAFFVSVCVYAYTLGLSCVALRVAEIMIFLGIVFTVANFTEQERSAAKLHRELFAKNDESAHDSTE